MVIDQATYDANRKKKIKIDEPGTINSGTINPKDIWGVIPSSSHYGAYYLITGEENNLSCSCPASVECRHLKDIKNGKGTCLRISGFIPEKDKEHT